MKKNSSWIKVAFLNIVITFSLLGILFFLPPFGNLAYKILLDENFGIDKRANLPNYKEVKWANKHFEEFSELKRTSVMDF